MIWSPLRDPKFDAINSAVSSTGTLLDGRGSSKSLQSRLSRRSDETLGELSSEWTSSPEWTRYTAKTQRVHKIALRKIADRYGDVPLAVLDDPRAKPSLMRWRASLAHTPAATDNLFGVLSALLTFGVSIGKLLNNIARGIGDLYCLGRRAVITWTASELAMIVAKANDLGHPEIADAASLAHATGYRLGDLITASRRGVQSNAIVKRLEKRHQGKRPIAVIPRDENINRLLAKLGARYRRPGVDELLVNHRGEPWRDYNLDIGFRKIRDACGIGYIDECTGFFEPKHLHDIRGTKATELLTNEGLSDTEVARFLGWSERYVRTIRSVYVDEKTRVAGLARRVVEQACHSHNQLTF